MWVHERSALPSERAPRTNSSVIETPHEFFRDLPDAHHGRPGEPLEVGASGVLLFSGAASGVRRGAILTTAQGP